MSKTLTEILQPLVDLVPQFKNIVHLRKWVREHSQYGSNTVAAIVSLAKWKQSRKIGTHPNGRPIWNLGTGMWECALCVKFGLMCSNECPLAKCGGRCTYGRNLHYRLASRTANKQPLIDALEKAAVCALVNELREKCEATVKEALK